MQRAPKKTQDGDTNEIFDFIFRNAMGSPVMFEAEPLNAEMKANTWGKVVGVNTALYIKFADGGAIKITGTQLA